MVLVVVLLLLPAAVVLVPVVLAVMVRVVLLLLTNVPQSWTLSIQGPESHSKPPKASAISAVAEHSPK